MPVGDQAGPRKDIEHAVNLVRGLLAAVAAATILTAGAGRAATEMIGPGSVVAAIGVGAMLMAVLGVRLTSDDARGRGPVLVLHALDVAMFGVLAGALETYVTDAGWALFVVPIVVASLRLSDVAVVGTWFLGSCGYVIAGQIGWIAVDGGIEVLVGRIGVLLAVAAGVALLTRWLQEGWHSQAEVATAAEVRSDRLASIEAAARAMRDDGSADIIETCTSWVPVLGFEAATATADGQAIAVAGEDGVVPADQMDHGSEAEEAVVTCWSTAGKNPCFVASVIEPASGCVISGWQTAPVDDAAAHALFDLVANATNALNAARHLEHARYKATHDPLTNLANRAEFHRHLDVVTARTNPVALLYIDLDHFKTINDTHGHLAGDEVLTTVSARLTRAVGQHGLVARLGGDEFAIILDGPPARHAAKFAADLRLVLNQPIAIDALRLTATASIGVAIATGPIDPTTLVDQADRAAYAAKAGGRNRYATVSESRTPAPAPS